nr:unnamed protein product [Callosobruchus chinensis]
MLEKFESGTSNDVYSIVTGDELSLYSYDVPMRGQHQKVWSFEEDIPTTVKLQLVFQVEQYLKSTGLSLLEHPPNSPDLSPCDCGLFPYINRTLKGHQFEDDEELINAWDQACAEISMDKWNEIFDNWFQRMAKCIEMEGEYIEKI